MRRLVCAFAVWFAYIKIGGCTGSSEFIQVKMPHCWKSHAAAQMLMQCYFIHILLEPSREKTSLWDLQTGKAQLSLLSYMV